MELLTTPEPHLIPGYAGYCPQYRFRCGETFAKTTHKLLLDPAVNHADMLILSSRAVGEVIRPLQRDIHVVNARAKKIVSLFVHPMLPGYEGFIPRLDTRCGQRFAVHATEQVAEFERQQSRYKETRDLLRRRIDAQRCGQGKQRDLKDHLVREKRRDYRNHTQAVPLLISLLLINVIDRGDSLICINICLSFLSVLFLRFLRILFLRDRQQSNEMQLSNGENYTWQSFIRENARRYAKHISQGNARFDTPPLGSALRDCTAIYREEVTISGPDPPILVQPSEIYHKHVGLIPNYLGHVPGAAFRYGKTFEADTRDAKRWLRIQNSV
ncbi:UPF0605 protein CG18335-like [Odontomachus brunneus]|uniref:UPF0605 protein CG18335-like n=1 Tax=Odontomachus brunneus TaxID=486640 RepID=UPI0013F2773C|nr:UPF0605 protein CG18335-like [Odontomachus brunneus]